MLSEDPIHPVVLGSVSPKSPIILQFQAMPVRNTLPSSFPLNQISYAFLYAIMFVNVQLVLLHFIGIFVSTYQPREMDEEFRPDFTSNELWFDVKILTDDATRNS